METKLVKEIEGIKIEYGKIYGEFAYYISIDGEADKNVTDYLSDELIDDLIRETRTNTTRWKVTNKEVICNRLDDERYPPHIAYKVSFYMRDMY